MTEPTDFETWCQHYDYDPDTEQARTDYDEYRRQADLFADMLDLDDDDASTAGPTP